MFHFQRDVDLFCWLISHKKKQKHKSKGSIRTITKQVKADSFFNFFDPPVVPDDPNAEVDEDTQVATE